MNYGFIGSGNMANAIIKGMIKNNVADKSGIYIYDVNEEAKNKCKNEHGVLASNSNEELIENCDVIILAVKPNIFKLLLPYISKYLAKKQALIISIAAGQTFETMENLLGIDIPIIRVMPNMNAAVLESISAISANKTATKEHILIAEKCFNAVGKVIQIDESKSGAFAGIAGCSPAYTYLFIEALAKAGHKAGFTKKQSIEIVAQAVLGSAKLILESGEEPHSLIDKVCSPGGSTIEGICVLDEYRFESALVHAVDATIAKDKLLGIIK